MSLRLPLQRELIVDSSDVISALPRRVVAERRALAWSAIGV